MTGAEPISPSNSEQDHQPKILPKGLILGPDGKPCKGCTSFASWAALTKSKPSSASSPSSTPSSKVPEPTSLPADCPPDVDQLGNSTWILLHTITAQYPERPSPAQQASASSFVYALSQLYPCWSCATDFRSWLAQDNNTPRVSSRHDFGKWMCEAHNAVNKKLGKNTFDCERWEERWRTGWKDGRCA